MRLRAILFALIALVGAGAGAWALAAAAAGWLEQRTRTDMAQTFDAAGIGWITVQIDGLIVDLGGEAPDEAGRLRALGLARQVVDARRIEDRITVAAASRKSPPAFELDLLRDEADISLIGLVPQPGGRQAIQAGLAQAGLGGHVADMLETADYPVPDGWRAALDFGLRAVGRLPRAKISIGPGHVTVIAVADTDVGRAALEAALRAEAPAGLRVDLRISAPRPVIAPFALDFTLRDGLGRFDACSAESAADVAAIAAAARTAGFRGDPACAIGLGAPVPDWADAIAKGLSALRDLGGGRFAIRDIDAVLTGPEGVDPEQLTTVGARLDAALPDVISLTTVAAPRMEIRADGSRVYAPRFSAILNADGFLSLGGALRNSTSRAAVQNYAAALFGGDRVSNATVVDPNLPEGWPGKVLVGVAALSELKAGTLQVTPEAVSLSGKAASADTSARVSAVMTAKLGDAVAIDVTHDPETVAKAAALTGPPPDETQAPAPPEICAEQIAAILDSESIQFAAGSAVVAPASRGVIQAIADVLRGCPRATFEVGGHTDSKGGEDANQRLSEKRAAAVVTALRDAGLQGVTLTAKGYGASDPIADNGTEAGRASNRRIAFTAPPPLPATDPAAGPVPAGAASGAATGGGAGIDGNAAPATPRASGAATTIGTEAGPATAGPGAPEPRRRPEIDDGSD